MTDSLGPSLEPVTATQFVAVDFLTTLRKHKEVIRPEPPTVGNHNEVSAVFGGFDSAVLLCDMRRDSDVRLPNRATGDTLVIFDRAWDIVLFTGAATFSMHPTGDLPRNRICSSMVRAKTLLTNDARFDVSWTARCCCLGSLIIASGTRPKMVHAVGFVVRCTPMDMVLAEGRPTMSTGLAMRVTQGRATLDARLDMRPPEELLTGVALNSIVLTDHLAAT